MTLRTFCVERASVSLANALSYTHTNTHFLYMCALNLSFLFHLLCFFYCSWTRVTPVECLSQTASTKHREERPQHDLLWLNCSGDHLIFKLMNYSQHAHTNTHSLLSDLHLGSSQRDSRTRNLHLSICLSVSLR